jgi:hypothetical protein
MDSRFSHLFTPKLALLTLATLALNFLLRLC